MIVLLHILQRQIPLIKDLVLLFAIVGIVSLRKADTHYNNQNNNIHLSFSFEADFLFSIIHLKPISSYRFMVLFIKSLLSSASDVRCPLAHKVGDAHEHNGSAYL